MTDAIELQALRKLAVFVPELKPLLPEAAQALVTLVKLQTLLQPIIERVQQHQPALWEAAEIAPQIEQMFPDISKLIDLAVKLRAIAAIYQTKFTQA